VDVAEQNLLANNISPACFCLGTGDLVSGVDQKFDIITANILTQTIVPMIPQIPGLLTGDKIFITSGIVDRSKNKVVEELEKHGFEIMEVLFEGEWVAIASKII
jgi:ribosomal protein L11 methyltransferase